MSLGDRFTIEAMSIFAPRVVGGRLVGILLFEMRIDILAGYDICLALLLMVDGVVERFAFVEDVDLALRVLTDSDLSLAECIRRARGLDLVDDLFVLQGQVLGKGAGFLKRKDLVEVLIREEQRAVGIEGTSGLDGKAAVEILDEFRGEGIGIFDVGDISQTQLLDQTVLQGAKYTLYPAFGLGRVGADDLDVQVFHRSAKLGHSRAGEGIFDIHPEDAVFVAVEGHRQAVTSQIMASGLEVAEGGLSRREKQFHQSAGGIIDVCQQIALRSAVFKPGMR